MNFLWLKNRSGPGCRVCPRNTGVYRFHEGNPCTLHAKAEYMDETFLFQPVIRK